MEPAIFTGESGALDSAPWLDTDERLDIAKVRQLIDELRRRGGRELWLRSYDSPLSAGPTATRIRRILGSDFYVRRTGGDIYARARRVGEPPIKLRKIRLGETWVTLEQAAEMLDMSSQWLRIHYLNTGKLKRYRFGTRVVLRREDVNALKPTIRTPGGAWAST